MNGSGKRDRQAAIRRLVASRPIANQGELVDELRALGFDVTQATASRDIAELGLVKILRADRHVYVAPEDVAPPPRLGIDDRLRRLLGEMPVTVGRSALTLVLRTSPGMANAIGQAIDQSSLQEQEGTLAGDDTLLVLFADEPLLERWLERFRGFQSLPGGLASPTPEPQRPLEVTS